MDVIVLGVFVELSELTTSVDHAGVHGDRFFENIIDEVGNSGLSHGINAPF